MSTDPLMLSHSLGREKGQGKVAKGRAKEAGRLQELDLDHDLDE